MPTISTPSKIAGTKSHGANVIFSGSTSDEREAVVADVIKKTGATLVPPYDHPDIMLGQGTQALELEQQTIDLISEDASLGIAEKSGLDAVIAPIGGGGMLSGICTALDGTGIKVFGAEPNFEGANDAEIGLKQGERVEKVKTLTIADGLRTPVGKIPWSVITDKSKLAGIYSVDEEQIKAALRVSKITLPIVRPTVANKVGASFSWSEQRSSANRLLLFLWRSCYTTRTSENWWSVKRDLKDGMLGSLSRAATLRWKPSRNCLRRLRKLVSERRLK
jgi:threonine dehydratase